MSRKKGAAERPEELDVEPMASEEAIARPQDGSLVTWKEPGASRLFLSSGTARRILTGGEVCLGLWVPSSPLEGKMTTAQVSHSC